MARVIGKAVVEVVADVDNFRGQLGRLSGNIGTMLGGIGTAIAAVGFAQLGKEAIQFGADTTIALDQATAMFRGLTDSEAETQEMLQRLTEYAINTPFELPGVSKMAAQLVAVGEGFGVTTDNVTDYLDVIGNVTSASGGTEDTMVRIVRVLGQMSSTGKVLGQDMNQLAQNIPGLDVWGALAEGTGKSVEELRALQDAGKLDELLTGNEAVAILLESMKEFPGAAGAMDRQMQTLGGSMSKFREQLGLALSQGLEPFFDVLQKTMGDPKIQSAIAGLIAVFSEFASELIAELAPVLPVLIDALGTILDSLKPLIPAIAALAKMFAQVLVAAAPLIEVLAIVISWVAELLAQLEPTTLMAITVALIALWAGFTGPIALVIGGITALVALIIANWDTIVSVTEGMVDKVVAAWDWLWDKIIQPTIDFIKDLIAPFQELYNVLVGNSIIPDLVNAIIGWFQTLFDFVSTIFNAIKDVIVAVWNGIKTAIEVVLKVIVTIVTTYFNVYRTIIETAFNVIKTVVETVWNGIKTVIDTALWLIKTIIENYINGYKTVIETVFNAAKTVVETVWNGIRTAIETPIRKAWEFVRDKVNAIKDLVGSIGDAIGKIPGAGLVGDAVGWITGNANGGIINRPTLSWLGEGYRPEAVIPLTNPGRAMQLMQESGLDRLAARMNGAQGWGGPLVSMPGAIIQDATDADLVAQRTMIALKAAMVA